MLGFFKKKLIKADVHKFELDESPKTLLFESIETERLILRLYSNGDENVFLEFVRKNREHLRKFKVIEEWVNNINSLEESKVYIKQMRLGWNTKSIIAYGIWLRDDIKNYIGEFKLFHIDWKKKELEWGIFLDKEFEGKLYPSEISEYIQEMIFEKMEFSKIYSTCHKDNFASKFFLDRSKITSKEYEKDDYVYYSTTRETYFQRKRTLDNSNNLI